ncbi:MAG: GFA family protein [Myxococcota bacterium]
MRFEGSCQCGAVRYAFEAERLLGYLCHCRECQHQSSSAFGMTVPMLADRLEWEGIPPHRWVRPAHSGRTTACLFCPQCGSRLIHQDALTPTYCSVKAGGLDRAADVEIVGHLWAKRRIAGLGFVDQLAGAKRRKLTA